MKRLKVWMHEIVILFILMANILIIRVRSIEQLSVTTFSKLLNSTNFYLNEQAVFENFILMLSVLAPIFYILLLVTQNNESLTEKRKYQILFFKSRKQYCLSELKKQLTHLFILTSALFIFQIVFIYLFIPEVIASTQTIDFTKIMIFCLAYCLHIYVYVQLINLLTLISNHYLGSITIVLCVIIVALSFLDLLTLQTWIPLIGLMKVVPSGEFHILLNIVINYVLFMMYLKCFKMKDLI